MLLAGTQFLCFGEYILYKGNENYSINSCDTIEIFYNIRTDLDKLKYATHITKIIQEVTTENENTYKILQLYLNTLYVISEIDKDISLILSSFKMKLLCFLGFKPRIETCINCEKKENLVEFSIKHNGIVCEECAKQIKGTIKINASALKALKYIEICPTKKLYNFNLKDEGLEELKLISKLYFNEKLEKEYKLEEF